MDKQAGAEVADAVFAARSAVGQWLPVAAAAVFLAIACWVTGLGIILVAAVVVLIVVALLGVWLNFRMRRARVSAARPAAVLYDGLLTEGLRQASRRLGQGALLGNWMTVALTDDGLEFWGRARQAPELAVTWHDVVSAQPGEAKYTSQFHPAVIVEVETDVGRTQLPVVVPSSHLIGLPSVARLNDLLSSIRGRIPRRPAKKS